MEFLIMLHGSTENDDDHSLGKFFNMVCEQAKKTSVVIDAPQAASRPQISTGTYNAASNVKPSSGRQGPATAPQLQFIERLEKNPRNKKIIADFCKAENLDRDNLTNGQVDTLIKTVNEKNPIRKSVPGPNDVLPSDDDMFN